MSELNVFLTHNLQHLPELLCEEPGVLHRRDEFTIIPSRLRCNVAPFTSGRVETPSLHLGYFIFLVCYLATFSSTHMFMIFISCKAPDGKLVAPPLVNSYGLTDHHTR